MKQDDVVKSANIFKLISDPTRLKILKILFTSKGNFCVNDISKRAGTSHSATSHQLAKLEARGIVSSFRTGRTICYKINQGSLTNNLKKAINLFNQ